jgi:phasin family protein
MSTTTTAALHHTDAAIKEGIDRTMFGIKDGIASATGGIEQMQTTMRDGMQKAMKTAEDMFSFSQGNIEAFTRSSQIFASGMQDLGQTMAAAAKSSLDETMSTFKALTTVKSFKEAIDLQSSLIRSTMEKAVSQTGHLTDTTLKLSEQAMAPISARVTLATQQFSRLG